MFHVKHILVIFPYVENLYIFPKSHGAWQDMLKEHKKHIGEVQKLVHKLS